MGYTMPPAFAGWVRIVFHGCVILGEIAPDVVANRFARGFTRAASIRGLIACRNRARRLNVNTRKSIERKYVTEPEGRNSVAVGEALFAKPTEPAEMNGSRRVAEDCRGD